MNEERKKAGRKTREMGIFQALCNPEATKDREAIQEEYCQSAGAVLNAL